MREKALSLESSFHNRMSPSQDPNCEMKFIHDDTLIRNRNVPDAKRSEYRKLAMAVIHLGVSMSLSVSDWA
jgi:hypothetical protein